MGLFSRLLRRRRMNPRRTGLLSGLAGLRDRMPPRRNMFFGGRRRMNPFLGMNNLPRMSFLPPSIAEAQGRNLSNVGLLPDYMQPGGSGMPDLDITTDEPIRNSDIMPRDPVFGVNLPKPRPILPGVMPQPNPITYGPVTPPPGMLKPVDLMPTLPNNLPQQPDPIVDMQGRMGMENGGDADKSDFPDLSGDGKITKKDILIGRGVIEMGNGGNAADEQARQLMNTEDDMPMIDNDAEFRNAQSAKMAYRKFLGDLPTGFRKYLPTLDEIYGEALVPESSVNPEEEIGMMLEELNMPEKKTLNFPMMSR